MQITNEMKERAVKASSAEELKKIAEEYGITISDEEAEKCFVFARDGELTDAELDIVAGGKSRKDPDPKYKNGTHLWLGYFTTQNYLEIEVVNPEFYIPGEGWRYLVQPVGYDFMQNEYLETRKYVHTSDPGHGWHD